MMNLKKDRKVIATTLLITLVTFGYLFLSRQNYEFLFYIGIIVLTGILIIATDKKVKYSSLVLWGLVVWAILHMAGGGVYIEEKRLYEIVLIPIVSEPYYIFKYDQLVHIIGFGVATILMFDLLKPHLRNNSFKGFSLWLVIVMAGLGIGAINEIIEFSITVAVPETGVGGYENTSLDLLADLIGGILAVFIIKKCLISKS